MKRKPYFIIVQNIQVIANTNQIGKFEHFLERVYSGVFYKTYEDAEKAIAEIPILDLGQNSFSIKKVYTIPH